MKSISSRKTKAHLYVKRYMITRIASIADSPGYWETYNVRDPFYTIFQSLWGKMKDEKE